MKSIYERAQLTPYDNLKAWVRARPLVLGARAGADGGYGGPPGGYQGYLSQKRVAYDSTEAAASGVADEPSLLDNLKHIRYRITTLEEQSGLEVQLSGVTVATGVSTFNVRGNANVTFVSPGVVELDVLSGGSSVYHHDVLDPDAYDDHLQYLNEARGDARYYVRSSIDTMFSNTINNTSFTTPGQLIVGTGMYQFGMLNPSLVSGYVLTADPSSIYQMDWKAQVAGHTIQYSGIPVTNRINLNFTGNVEVSDYLAGNATIINIPSSHVHDASEITTGILSPSVVGSGTRNGRKFLRDDGTWQTITTSGGGTTTYSTWDPDAPPESSTAKDDEFDDSSIDAKWTWNGSSYTSSSEGDQGFGITGILLNAGDSVDYLYQSLPAGDYTIITKVSISSTRTNYNLAGLCLLEDGTDITKRIELYHLWISNGQVGVEIASFNNKTSFNTSRLQSSLNIGNPTIYLRIRKNGLTHYFDYSYDGKAWIQIYDIALAFTPAHAGIYAEGPSSHAIPWKANFQFFRYIASDVTVIGALNGRVISR